MERISKVQQWMKQEKLEALLIESPVDLLYLTGMQVSLGKLLIECKAALHFLDGRYFEKGKKESSCPVQRVEEFPKALQKLKKVGFDSSFVTVDQYNQYREKHPDIEWNALPGVMRPFRLIKEGREIAILKEAAWLTWEGYQHILSLLKEGITEKELAFEFEFFCKKKGASDLAFEPIIAFGENSAYPHYQSGDVKLKKDQVVLIDIGAVCGHYSGDMTRTFFFGNPDPKLQKFYDWVRKAQKDAVKAIRPGVRLGMLDEIVREEFSKQGVEALYLHTLGHGIGLETHEYPRIRFDHPDKDLLLQPGMVFTVEPGLYQAGLGGIRYEDTVLVTETGVENFYPEDSHA